jgi:hypothetical protein
MTLANSIDPGHVSAKEHHFIVKLLPIAKIMTQVVQSRPAIDTAPIIWKGLGRVLCLSSLRCTLKQKCFKEYAPSGRLRTVMANNAMLSGHENFC